MAHPHAQQAPGTEPGGPEDSAGHRRVELARAFISQLLKAIKQIGMYRHNEGRFPEFLQPSLDALAAYHSEFGPLAIKVEQQNFLLLGQPLFTEESTLPFKFYRDGIRQLLFRPGLTIQELVGFTLVSLSEPERGADDLTAQLWRAGFEHLEYVVVEGFKIEEYSEEQVQVEVDQVVNFIYSRLRSSSDDSMRFARVSSDDLDLKMEGVEQIRGAVVTGVNASDELKARVQKEIEEQEGPRLFPKLVSAVFQVIEGGMEDASLVEDMIAQLLDALLLQEDFATINQILLKLRAMEQRAAANEALSRVRQRLVADMGQEQRVLRVGEILKSGKAKAPQEVLRYLQALDPSAVPVLLLVAETMEIPENRALLLDVLATFAKEMPDAFLVRLDSDRPQTVRDMVYVLEKSGYPDRVKLFVQLLKHRNLAVRLDVMSMLAKGRSPEGRKLIAEALDDPTQQVRMLAAKLLPEFDPERAFNDMVTIAKAPTFEKRAPEERAAFYATIGATGVPQALVFFNELLQTKATLLNRKKVTDEKILALDGLAAIGSVQAYKLLQGLVEDRSQPVELLAAARRAMYQTKRALFGDSAGPEEA